MLRCAALEPHALAMNRALNSATKLHEFDTVLTADSVEWCPHAGLEQLLACGTYQLEEGGRRHGTLSILEWMQHKSQLEPIVQLETQKFSDGILDMKWKCYGGKPILGLASSSGCVTFITMEQSEGEYVLCELGRADVALGEDKQGICLSLDWSKDPSEEATVVVSDSLGRVTMVKVEGSSCRCLDSWKAHQFEAWITALGHHSHLVFTGGDDCKLCVWDTRTDCTKPCFVSKRHQMGVCSLQAHPLQDHLLASGSYDETVLLWDTRNMAQPLKELRLGGGVWRIKWRNNDYIATACMHNGFNIVNCHVGAGDPMEVVCSYKEHQSLAYGVDWYRQSHSMTSAHDPAELALLSSCSFYDHSMHLWTVELNSCS